MKQLFSIIKFTFKENISNRVFNGFIFFGMIIIMMIVLLKDIAIYEEVQVIKDTGIFLIEFFMLLITVFISSTVFLKDKNEKSIYLILTKPVSRAQYITGRILGIIVTIFFNIFIMAIILAIVLKMQNSNIDKEFLLSIIFIFYKLSIIAALGVLFSIVSDSYVTANIFTFSMYIMAHAVVEIKKFSEEVTNVFYKFLLQILYYILPNYRMMNYKDYLKSMEIDLFKVTLYVVGYAVIVIVIANTAFYKKRI